MGRTGGPRRTSLRRVDGGAWGGLFRSGGGGRFCAVPRAPECLRRPVSVRWGRGWRVRVGCGSRAGGGGGGAGGGVVGGAGRGGGLPPAARGVRSPKGALEPAAAPGGGTPPPPAP